MKTLTDAITAAEAAEQNLTGADGAQLAAQAKFDAATLAKAAADAADRDAVTAFNGALDDLSAAALAAKRPPVVQ